MLHSRLGAVLLGLAASAATAAPPDPSGSLQHIVSTSTGSVWYLDRSTLKTNGRVTSAWLTMDHSRDRTEPARRSRALVEIECAARQFHWVQYFSYRRNGSALPERVQPNVVMSIAPGSPIESVWQGLCQGGGS